LEESVLSAEVEIAISPIVPQSDLLAAEQYLASRLTLFVAYDDPVGDRSITVTDLASVPLVIRTDTGTGGGTERLLNLIRERGSQPKIALRCDLSEAIIESVRRRIGVGCYIMTRSMMP